MQIMDHDWLLSSASSRKSDLSNHVAVVADLPCKPPGTTPHLSQSYILEDIYYRHCIHRKHAQLHNASQQRSRALLASAGSQHSPATKRARDHRIEYFQLLRLHVYHGQAPPLPPPFSSFMLYYHLVFKPQMSSSMVVS